MSVYMTEQEQLEEIKKWWNRNGNTITIILSIILFCIAGYRYYHWRQDRIQQQASIAYEHMMSAYSIKNIKSVRSYANDLITNYNHSVYADAAHMTLARIYVSKNNLDKAKSELGAVATKSSMPALKQIAKIRIARILASQKEYTNALSQLSSVEDSTYLPVINELKGDIYGATGHYQDAINSYHLAINEVKTNGMGNLFLEMKTNEMATKTQTTSSDEKKVQAA